VCILASQRDGTLYVGMTNNLIKRVYEHKHDLINSFTKRYGVHVVVFYEQTEDVTSAIQREKQIKAGNGHGKLKLLKETIQSGVTYMMVLSE